MDLIQNDCNIIMIGSLIKNIFRYTTFIILYPIGVTGELLCIYAAQKEVGETKIFTIEMPNAVNFIFDYQKFLWILMFLYVPCKFCNVKFIWDYIFNF